MSLIFYEKYFLQVLITLNRFCHKDVRKSVQWGKGILYVELLPHHNLVKAKSFLKVCDRCSKFVHKMIYWLATQVLINIVSTIVFDNLLLIYIYMHNN